MANESQTFGIDMGMHSGSMHDQPFHADVIDNQAQGDVDIDVDFANASMQAADRETGASIEVIPGGGAELFDQPIGDGVVDTSSAGHEAQEHAAGFAVEAAMRRARTSGLAQEAATLAAKKVDIGLPLESGPDPPAPTIKAGQILPSIRVAVKGPMLDIREYFAEKRGVIVGLPGAFTPSRMQNHIKGYHEICHQIKAHVGFLGCLVVNDPFVLKAWAKALGVETEMTFICDADCHLTKKLGLQTDISNLGMGIRCKRFAMIIGTGAEVKWIGFSEEEIQAPFVLQKLEEVFTESAVPPSWDYRQNGSDWAAADGLCAPSTGLRQSPINIVDDFVVIPSDETMNIRIKYMSNPSEYRVVNDGKNTFFREAAGFPPMGTVTVDGEEFYVDNFHFHSPSEHTFHGVDERRLVELHIVHANADRTKFVGIGVTFEPSEDDTPNPFLHAVLAAPGVPFQQPHGDVTIARIEMPIILTESLFAWGEPELPPDETSSAASMDESAHPEFYRYFGSATTPPCKENYLWFVKRESEPASDAQLERFSYLLKTADAPNGNFRELQNTNVESNRNNSEVYLVRGHQQRS